jgi:hypothetical protein
MLAIRLGSIIFRGSALFNRSVALNTPGILPIGFYIMSKTNVWNVPGVNYGKPAGRHCPVNGQGEAWR